ARSDPRFTTLLLGGFSALALALALVGLYSVLAHSVAQRRRELAIRLALGASTRSVMRLVFGQGFRLVAIGLLAGLAASAAASRLLTGMLFEVRGSDPESFAFAIVLFLAAAALAMYLPARRASQARAWEALR